MVCPASRKRENLGVSRGIVSGQGTVASTPNHAAVINDDRAHGNLAERERALGFAQSFLHPQVRRIA